MTRKVRYHDYEKNEIKTQAKRQDAGRALPSPIRKDKRVSALRRIRPLGFVDASREKTCKDVAKEAERASIETTPIEKEIGA